MKPSNNRGLRTQKTPKIASNAEQSGNVGVSKKDWLYGDWSSPRKFESFRFPENIVRRKRLRQNIINSPKLHLERC
jgi:hypothetical protein